MSAIDGGSEAIDDFLSFEENLEINLLEWRFIDPLSDRKIVSDERVLIGGGLNIFRRWMKEFVVGFGFVVEVGVVGDVEDC